MKAANTITGVLYLLFGAAVSHAATSGQTTVLNRISNETGVSMDTLQTQKSTTRLGNGELEKANLLANASGKSFDEIAAAHTAGEGWGKIAHDNGLNLGKIVSDAHRSNQATLHAQNNHAQNQNVRGNGSIHSRNTMNVNKVHGSTMRSAGHGQMAKSARGAVHGMGHRGR